MRLLITGGGGFIGARLARTLLARGQLCGQTIEQIVLSDQFPAPADLAAHPKIRVKTGPLLDHCQALAHEAVDGVFHLASAVSGECEADFDLGMRSNLDSTRALLDALRAQASSAATPARLVFSSSVAVFGPDDAVPGCSRERDAVDDEGEQQHHCRLLHGGPLIASKVLRDFAKNVMPGFREVGGESGVPAPAIIFTSRVDQGGAVGIPPRAVG